MIDPLSILALIDASITGYAHGQKLLEELFKKGLITAEQQAARQGAVAVSRALAGLPVAGVPGAITQG